MSEYKTNVMRLLDQKMIPYKSYCYEQTGETNGEKIAAILGEPPHRVYKTLVTESGKGSHYVFVIPVNRELNLKKAAKAVGEKSIAMLKSRELLPLTGYIHGGCSPIGMKKFFRTTLNAGAEGEETIFISAGKVGYQVEISPSDLAKIIRFGYADLCG